METAELKKRLARLLARISYREGNFTLASGKKSDYYFDCRQAALHPEGAWLIGSLFVDLLKGHDIAGIGGMTLGADPLVSATSVISYEKGRPLPGFLVRKESKGHGTNQYIEGLANFSPNDRVMILEDVVTTAGSALKALDRVRDAHLVPVGVCCVLDRKEGGAERLAEAGFPLTSLFTRMDIAQAAHENDAKKQL